MHREWSTTLQQNCERCHRLGHSCSPNLLPRDDPQTVSGASPQNAATPADSPVSQSEGEPDAPESAQEQEEDEQLPENTVPSSSTPIDWYATLDWPDVFANSAARNELPTHTEPPNVTGSETRVPQTNNLEQTTAPPSVLNFGSWFSYGTAYHPPMSPLYQLPQGSFLPQRFLPRTDGGVASGNYHVEATDQPQVSSEEEEDNDHQQQQHGGKGGKRA